MVLPDRFWDMVSPEPNTGCWLWTGIVSSYGYARFSYSKYRIEAHRLVFIFMVGAIPKPLQIDHKCRVRCCVNPDHMELVTSHENTLRGEAGVHNRRKVHCPQGHPYDSSNTLQRKPDKRHANGCRECRICRKRRKSQGRARGRDSTRG
jgi:hypothetical protein